MKVVRPENSSKIFRLSLSAIQVLHPCADSAVASRCSNQLHISFQRPLPFLEVSVLSYKENLWLLPQQRGEPWGSVVDVDVKSFVSVALISSSTLASNVVRIPAASDLSSVKGLAVGQRKHCAHSSVCIS